MIIYLILITSSHDNVWRSLEENCCWSLLGLKGLRLPITQSALQNDLSGQALLRLQERLLLMDYLLIDEYSMLGQTTMGRIDTRFRQATGLQEVLFGGKSVIILLEILPNFHQLVIYITQNHHQP